jgi:hypothetical protein
MLKKVYTNYFTLPRAAKILIFLFSLLLAVSLQPAEKRYSLFINGPSYSKHFSKYDKYFNNFHLGLGVEADYRLERNWFLGGHIHYMFKDSAEKKAYWGGLTIGKILWGRGRRHGFWAEPALIIGMMKKAEYNLGKLGFFVMPIFSVGYKFIALNAVYIPKITALNIPYHIALVQIKLRVAAW